jgi:ATP-dependent exoDNAse (exonuclease V) alpha subunit
LWGRFCGGIQQFHLHVTVAHRAKAYALKDGILLTQQIGASRVIIVSNSSMVAETMENRDFSSIAAAVIYDECYAL